MKKFPKGTGEELSSIGEGEFVQVKMEYLNMPLLKREGRGLGKDIATII